MSSSPLKFEWGKLLTDTKRAEHLRHVRIVADPTSELRTTACKILISDDPNVGYAFSPSDNGLRCVACMEAVRWLATPAGRMIFDITGNVWPATDTIRVAQHVIKQYSLLATQLRSIRTRVESLYIGASPPPE